MHPHRHPDTAARPQFLRRVQAGSIMNFSNPVANPVREEQAERPVLSPAILATAVRSSSFLRCEHVELAGAGEPVYVARSAHRAPTSERGGEVVLQGCAAILDRHRTHDRSIAKIWVLGAGGQGQLLAPRTHL